MDCEGHDIELRFAGEPHLYWLNYAAHCAGFSFTLSSPSPSSTSCTRETESLTSIFTIRTSREEAVRNSAPEGPHECMPLPPSDPPSPQARDD
jgi:hypothetical protein